MTKNETQILEKILERLDAIEHSLLMMRRAIPPYHAPMTPYPLPPAPPQPYYIRNDQAIPTMSYKEFGSMVDQLT